MNALYGKVGIVTGAGSGIGRATAETLARHGATVTVVDVDEASALDTVANIEAMGGVAIPVVSDVTRASDIQRMVDETLARFHRVDVLHNNAGLIVACDTLSDITEEAWDLVVDVSLKAAYLGAKAVFPHMARQGGGVIINTSSMGAVSPLPHSPAYGAAKAGLISLTCTLAVMGQAHGIRSNTVLPSSVATHFRDNYPDRIKATMPAQSLLAKDIALAVYQLIVDESWNGSAIKVSRGEGGVEYWSAENFDYQWVPVGGKTWIDEPSVPDDSVREATAG